MYQLTELARDRTSDLIAQTEASRLAAAAKQAQPRPRARIPAVLRLSHHRKWLPELKFLAATDHK